MAARKCEFTAARNADSDGALISISSCAASRPLTSRTLGPPAGSAISGPSAALTAATTRSALAPLPTLILKRARCAPAARRARAGPRRFPFDFDFLFALAAVLWPLVVPAPSRLSTSARNWSVRGSAISELRSRAKVREAPEAEKPSATENLFCPVCQRVSLHEFLNPEDPTRVRCGRCGATRDLNAWESEESEINLAGYSQGDEDEG